MTRIFTLSLLFSFISLSLVAQEDELPLREKMMTALADEKLAGAAWSTVSPFGIITADAYGLKSSLTKRPLTPSDRIQVGSVTKTLLATGIFRLVTINKLSLDTPVEKILTNIKFENQWASSDPVTVRHLLDHTSGLEDLRFWQLFSEKVSANTPLIENFKRDPAVLHIYTRPGAQFAYSNMGYTLLGMVIEAVTGQRYEDYLDMFLLEPLGMTRSTFHFVSQQGAHADKTLAMGHLEEMKAQPTVPMYLRPAGQFTTTANDMGIFIRFLMSDGILHRSPFIREDLLRSMGNPKETEATKHGLEIGYSGGLMKRDAHKVIGYAHSGNTIGYHAMIYLFPEEKKGFFISHNMDSETANYEVFNKILIQSLDIPEGKTQAAGEMPKDIRNWKGNYIAAKDKIKTFAYLDFLTNFVTIIPQEKQVLFCQFQKDDKVLSPAGHHLFKSAGKISPSHVFYTDPTGNQMVSTGFGTFKKISSFYLWGMWMSFILGVLALLYLFISGLVKSLTQRMAFLKSLRSAPFLSLLCLLIPGLLFLNQNFTALGDVTPASISLAIVTPLIPAALLLGIWAYFKHKTRRNTAILEIFALILALQLFLVMMYWGMVPFLLWA
ncbi:serine hydrolase domain-containing protein [Pedobacter caeni]|uniref:CubicO group peptidase, beta-lactamase class C family n=1 Tax=Pedobacter caeni TaxID=288992 RepID=A0A1M4VB65_9SPHI|nr:serine hydrolase domain-containing protein [Pedobacter caeni]SHE66090.1 CubicO group peptidase, beta-lactamase class C family [Pedobacter caeni]